MDGRRSPFAVVREVLQHDGAMTAVTLTSVAAYLAAYFDQGWIAHDEGLLGQVAVRVLHGQWPHRHFDDPYTGGLSLMHAAAMRVLGTDLVSIRLLLLVASIGFAAVLYRIARRVTAPGGAAFVTWLCITWSVPNYFAALPSWYNLMLAAFGTLCLMRFIEGRRTRDLVLAGALGGLSLLIKPIGLYYVAASLLLLVFVEALRCEEPQATGASRVDRWTIRVALFAFGAFS